MQNCDLRAEQDNNSTMDNLEEATGSLHQDPSENEILFNVNGESILMDDIAFDILANSLEVNMEEPESAAAPNENSNALKI